MYVVCVWMDYMVGFINQNYYHCWHHPPTIVTLTHPSVYINSRIRITYVLSDPVHPTVFMRFVSQPMTTLTLKLSIV